MCNLYRSSHASTARKVWKTKNSVALDWPDAIVSPRKDGLFIRPTTPSTPAAAGQATSSLGSHLQLVAGRWGLIPWFADAPNIRYAHRTARCIDHDQLPAFSIGFPTRICHPKTRLRIWFAVMSFSRPRQTSFFRFTVANPINDARLYARRGWRDVPSRAEQIGSS